MKDNYMEYRNRLIHIAYILIGLIAIAQLIMMYPLQLGGSISNVKEHVFQHIMVPGVVSLTMSTVAFFLNRTKKIKPNIKNAIVLVNASILCCVVGVSECSFPSTIAVVLIPIFLATAFGQVIYLDLTVSMSLISLLVIAFVTPHYSFSFNENLLYCYIEMIPVILITRIICTVLVDVSKSNQNKLQNHENQKATMESQLLCDAMTGLYNHASFYGFLEKLTTGGSDTEYVSLAVIDIDNFKSVNDTYGHSKGDEVILYLSGVLKEHFGESHYVCRYGGEEFAVIFNNIRGKDAKKMMDEALADFRNHKFEWKPESVTFSCGVCEYMQGRMTAKELFAIADKVLYRAKNSGKNQCLI